MKETDLRWQLRQLPREVAPGHDLWPAIAAGIGRRSKRRKRLSWPALSLAASALIVAGLVWRVPSQSAPGPAPDPIARLLQREAVAMTAEYEAALGQYRGAPMPQELTPALDTLDRSAAQVRQAMAADPDSVALLQRLQSIYSRRLELTQRGLAG